jgi:hypothetical protein
VTEVLDDVVTHVSQEVISVTGTTRSDREGGAVTT